MNIRGAGHPWHVSRLTDHSKFALCPSQPIRNLLSPSVNLIRKSSSFSASRPPPPPKHHVHQRASPFHLHCSGNSYALLHLCSIGPLPYLRCWVVDLSRTTAVNPIKRFDRVSSYLFEGIAPSDTHQTKGGNKAGIGGNPL